MEVELVVLGGSLDCEILVGEDSVTNDQGLNLRDVLPRYVPQGFPISKCDVGGIAYHALLSLVLISAYFKTSFRVSKFRSVR